MQVNTTWEPQAEDMIAYVIRAANDKVSEVETSNTMLNSIHEIIDRAIKVRHSDFAPYE